MKYTPTRIKLLLVSSLLSTSLLITFMVQGEFGLTGRVVAAVQQQPSEPTRLPSSPPAPTQPQGPAPAPTVPAIPTSPPQTTPVPPGPLPPDPPSNPTSVRVTPSNPAERRRDEESSVVTLTQAVSPNKTVRMGGLITYTLAATNRGLGSSKNVQVSLPLAGSGLQVLDVTFSREGPRVSVLSAEALMLETGTLFSGGDTITATIRVRMAANMPSGATIATRFEGSNGKRSNLVTITMGTQDQSVPFAQMSVASANGPAGNTPVFSANIFIPGEPVSFWYNRPDGSVVELNTLAADGDGVLVGEFDTTGLEPGRYSMVGRGNWSGITAVGAFEVER